MISSQKCTSLPCGGTVPSERLFTDCHHTTNGLVMALCLQLHEEAWYRFVILSLIAVGVYAGYGQYNAVPSTSDHSSVAYHGVPSEAP